MDRNTQIETNREMLTRIVAQLFAMAALADHVSTRPRRVRRRVLEFLRQAEIVAWGVALENAYGLIASPELLALTFSLDGNSAADARHLAVVLRALALTLTVKLALHRNFADDRDKGRHAAGSHPPQNTHVQAFVVDGLNRVSPPRQAIPP